MLAVACALLGVVVGSLLTVVIDRVPAKRPVASAARALLRRPASVARDRHTPLLQVATAGLFAAAALRFGADWSLPAYLVFLAAMVAVAVIDLEHFIVPNRVVAATLAVTVPLLAVAALLSGDWGSFGSALLGAVFAGGGLLVVNLISPQGLGMGDVKLAVVLGLFLGWIDLGHVLLGLFLGFLLGAVGGVVLILAKQRTRRDHVPFAPYLASGAVLAVLAGTAIMDWYLG